MAHWKKRETLFSEYELEAILPGAWQLRPDSHSERWHYRSADKREQITFSRSEEAGKAATALKDALSRHRRAVELGFGRVAGLELSVSEIEEQNGFPAVGLFGEGDGGNIRFHSLLVWIEGVVWTLFHESTRFSEADALEKAEAIWKTLRAR